MHVFGVMALWVYMVPYLPPCLEVLLSLYANIINSGMCLILPHFMHVSVNLWCYYGYEREADQFLDTSMTRVRWHARLRVKTAFDTSWKWVVITRTGKTEMTCL